MPSRSNPFQPTASSHPLSSAPPPVPQRHLRHSPPASPRSEPSVAARATRPLPRSASRRIFLPPLKPQPAVMLPSHFPLSAPSLHAQPSPSPQPPPQLSLTRPAHAHPHSERLTHPFSLHASSSSRPSASASNPAASTPSTPQPTPAASTPSLDAQAIKDSLRFRPGDLVLCRYFNYPVWPATVAHSHQPAFRGRYFTMRPTRNGADAIMAYWVLFSGENVGGWIRTDCLVPYHPVYAATLLVPSDIPIFRDRRIALRVAEREYNQRPSRFGYHPADMRHLVSLCSIPINDFVDIKSQDSQADRESDRTHSNQNTPSPPQDYMQDSDTDDHNHSSEHAGPRRSGRMTLRPRLAKREQQLQPSRVLRSRSRKPSAVETEPSQSDDDDCLYIPVKSEPKELVTTANHAAPAGRRPTLPNGVQPQHQQPTLHSAAKPFVRRKRGRPRKHPLPEQKTPADSRITKPEPAVTQPRVVKGEPIDALTHIPTQMSYRRQFRRKKRGRPRKVVQPPEPPASEAKESTSQIIDRMQRRITRQEKQIVLLSQQQKLQDAAQGSSVGHSTLPSISFLTKTPDPDNIKAQTERFVQKMLNFQRLAVQFGVEAERFQEAKKNCEEAWKAVVEEGRGTEEQAMELEGFLSKLPSLAEFLRTVRM